MNKKTINTLVVVGGVLVAFIIAKKFLMDKPKGDSSSSGGGTGGDTGGGTGGGQLDDLDFMSMANQLFESMDGYGTNYKNIYNILRGLKTQSDWNKLQQTYGIRKISSGRGNIFVSDFNGNLKNALVSELNSDEMSEVKKILSSKGIAY